MSDKTPNKKKKSMLPSPNPRPGVQLWVLAGLLVFLFGVIWATNLNAPLKINQQKFEQWLAAGDVRDVTIRNSEKKEVYVTIKQESLQKPEFRDLQSRRPSFGGGTGTQFYFPVVDAKLFQENFDAVQKNLPAEQRLPLNIDTTESYGDVIGRWGIIILLMVGFWFLMRRMSGAGGPGGQIFNIGKSRAALFEGGDKVKITFKDVAGLEEAKEEVQEIVEFLKNPSKFTILGGKIPKGALLVGPPGTGKTLLAKAVAGEADVPFFSLSGSDFVEMFVGVGASRVRDLFGQAEQRAPCIVFIDELDALGKTRGGHAVGGHDEREQTLNQLLVEMDGFDSNEGVILIAATNRPDVLDPALLRPGRFDRHIVVDWPDLRGREGILRVHTRRIPISDNVNLEVIARGTPGMAGADLANLVNEAALLAARRGKKKVEMIDVDDAREKVQ